jgi:hypothetical protein
MQLVPFGSVSAAWMSPLGSALVSPMLGSVQQLHSSPLIGLCILFIVIPIFFLLLSIPTWIASKLVVSKSATYGSALKVHVFYFLAWLGLAVIANVLQASAEGRPGSSASVMLGAGMTLALITVGIMIPAKVYGISGSHALGLNVLSGIISLVIFVMVFLGGAAVVGFASAKAPLEASVQQLRHVQESGALPTLASFAPSAKRRLEPLDQTSDIDGLLNAALHPAGQRPSLNEREDMVRTLQQKLQAQQRNLLPGDARAALVYQNQFNRYMLLLETVKTERKAQTARDRVANRQTMPQ